MSYEELRRYEGRLEVWDAELQTAWMVREPTSPTHERPSHRLARLVERIAAVRGSAIECYGAMDLLLRDALGAARRIMQADQTVYLHPSRVDLLNAEAMRVGEHNFPDVVLEVDHTTDVRRGKLRLYESWGFPELWVEVPDRRARRRPESRPSGLTIHLLERGAYRSSPVSRAFPGWTTQAIHEAMNEPEPSARTHAILEGVGRALGAREGTGPDDDPLLRSLRDQSRTGRKAGPGWCARCWHRGVSMCRRDSRPTCRHSPNRRWPLSSRRRSTARASRISANASASADSSRPAFPRSAVRSLHALGHQAPRHGSCPREVCQPLRKPGRPLSTVGRDLGAHYGRPLALCVGSAFVIVGNRSSCPFGMVP